MTTSFQTNAFLNGNFAPVAQEITETSLTITGKIPENLQGSFIRNGPNPQFINLDTYHWFDGDGMLHQVEFQSGNVTYRNRYVKTEGFVKEKAANQPLYGSLAQMSANSIKNVSNTALAWHHEELLSLWEGGEPYRVNISNLDTLGPETFTGKLRSPFTAHPKIDPVTGEMMWIGYQLGMPPYLQYGIISPQGELVKTIPIDLPVGVMMHDFAITENYTIFLNLPLTFRPEKMTQGQSPLQFETATPSYFGVLPRHADSCAAIRWFEAPSCFIFHTLNAFEVGDEVILIACRMEASNVFGPADNPEIAAKGDIPFLTRWRFNLKDNSVQEEVLSRIPSEFPRINEAYLGRQNRYGYTVSMASEPMPLMNGIIKHDLETGKFQHYLYESGCYGGEVVFAPNPEGVAEDDGWLMTFVYNQARDTSELIILSAQDLESEVARIVIPQRVPYGFHGIWVSDAHRLSTSA